MKLQQLRQIIREEAKRALNEGSLANAAGVEGDKNDLKNSVDGLEDYLKGFYGNIFGSNEKGNIEWTTRDWDELGRIVADIIHEARMLGGYDDKHY